MDQIVAEIEVLLVSPYPDEMLLLPISNLVRRMQAWAHSDEAKAELGPTYEKRVKEFDELVSMAQTALLERTQFKTMQ